MRLPPRERGGFRIVFGCLSAGFLSVSGLNFRVVDEATSPSQSHSKEGSLPRPLRLTRSFNVDNPLVLFSVSTVNLQLKFIQLLFHFQKPGLQTLFLSLL